MQISSVDKLLLLSQFSFERTIGKFVISDSDPASPSEEREAFSYAGDRSDEAQSSHRSVNNNEVSSSDSSSFSEESSSSRWTGGKGVVA